MKKVLVVEDDKFLVNVYRIKLAKAGYEVQIAYDGQQALTVLDAFTPDIILLDLILPIKDGFSFLKDFRQIEKFKGVPVIIASNLGQNEDVSKGLSLGANDYLIKSDTTLDVLIDKIKALTEKGTP